MAMQEITKYVVHHKTGGSTTIAVYYAAGPANEIKSLNNAEAIFLVDLLRTTKPIYYDDATGMIQTNFEEPGKGIRR